MPDFVSEKGPVASPEAVPETTLEGVPNSTAPLYPVPQSDHALEPEVPEHLPRGNRGGMSEGLVTPANGMSPKCSYAEALTRSVSLRRPSVEDGGTGSQLLVQVGSQRF